MVGNLIVSYGLCEVSFIDVSRVKDLVLGLEDFPRTDAKSVSFLDFFLDSLLLILVPVLEMKSLKMFRRVMWWFWARPRWKDDMVLVTTCLEHTVVPNSDVSHCLGHRGRFLENVLSLPLSLTVKLFFFLVLVT